MVEREEREEGGEAKVSLSGSLPGGSVKATAKGDAEEDATGGGALSTLAVARSRPVSHPSPKPG